MKARLPLASIRELLALPDDGRTILLTQHHDGGVGGVGAVVRAIAAGAGYNALVAYPFLDCLVAEAYAAGKMAAKIMMKPGRGADRETLLFGLASLLDVRIVNVHHTVTWETRRLLEVPGALGVPGILSLHDFYLCTGTLHFLRGEGLDQPSEETARELNGLLALPDRIVFSSKYLRTAYGEVLRKDYSTGMVINPGTPARKVSSSRGEGTGGRRLKIAYVGLAHRQKGIHRYLELMADHRDRAEWFVLGSRGPGFDEAQDEYGMKAGRDFLWSGFDGDVELQELLLRLDVDLILMPSTYLESFGIVYSVTVQTGIPVLAIDVGAVGERIREHPATGWLARDWPAFKELFQRLLESPGQITGRREALRGVTAPTVEEMSSAYAALYERAIEEGRARPAGKGKGRGMPPWSGGNVKVVVAEGMEENVASMHRRMPDRVKALKRIVGGIPWAGNRLRMAYRRLRGR